MNPVSIAMAVAALSAIAWLVPSAAARAEPDLIGKWRVVAAMAAPWVAEEQRKAAEGAAKRMLKLEIEFKAREVASRNRTLACKRATYEPTHYPVDAIFQGMLPEPNQVAVARNMGFTRSEVEGVDLRCTSGLFSYHFRDSRTALFAFDNVIYTIERQ